MSTSCPGCSTRVERSAVASLIACPSCHLRFLPAGATMASLVGDPRRTLTFQARGPRLGEAGDDREDIQRRAISSRGGRPADASKSRD